MPAFPRPPSFATTIHTELGAFQSFLENPSSSKAKEKAKKKRDMPVHRQSSDPVRDWGLIIWEVIEILCAETVGTGMLIFFGCMGLVTWKPEEPQNPLQGAIVFAVVVTSIIQIFGHISAAHLNPAVTIAFLVLGEVTPAKAIIYVISECVGAILGYGLLILLTPPHIFGTDTGLCCTVPHAGLTDLQAVAMEFVATCFLVMMVCACADPRNADKTDSIPLKFGCTILAISIAVGPYTGASMNPARTMGPSLWSGKWESHWVYWLGPCLSGLFTSLFYKAIFRRTPYQQSLHQEEVPLNQVKISVNKTNKK